MTPPQCAAASKSARRERFDARCPTKKRARDRRMMSSSVDRSRGAAAIPPESSTGEVSTGHGVGGTGHGVGGA
eukprot:3352720-Rhodomonas_salina.3